ncbi:MAG: hypothetical protein A2151_08565 [Candidatus Muproteobacteria bacterium RBG_16_65_34]|uniref:Uncharacterized protein n=1 Tax=Candidatus Muproteobacteria bacterium RBG_16_65_34 TaxID=1817760 RepID=A0A1F6TTW1_9PROT|nr:MAG: hypothetical protein A2151_08565 [Candidatus Muproteobacteria bacterium RBG_16_65_34]
MHTLSLYQFFRHQVQHGFRAQGLAEPETVDYVSEILARFAHTRLLYALRDAEGRPLEYIIDMLEHLRLAQHPEEGGRRERAREWRITRHVGEYTLFMSGLFRERLTARGELGYYIAHGSGAYGRCADYELNPVRQRLFRRLYRNFARFADTLDDMRRTQFPLAPLMNLRPEAATARLPLPSGEGMRVREETAQSTDTIRGSGSPWGGLSPTAENMLAALWRV